MKVSPLDVKQEVIVEGNKNIETTQEVEEKNGAKTFTQEEVNEIVRKRLAREREKADQNGVEYDLSDRENQLDQRELMVMAKEKLMAEGLPLELSDVLKYDNEKTLVAAIESIKRLSDRVHGSWGKRHQGTGIQKPDAIRDAMGLNH